MQKTGRELKEFCCLFLTYFVRIVVIMLLIALAFVPIFINKPVFFLLSIPIALALCLTLLKLWDDLFW
jgi:uncharacterized membrane protein YccC